MKVYLISKEKMLITVSDTDLMRMMFPKRIPPRYQCN